MVILQIIAGVALGLGGIGAVFWITFRQPPPPRPMDNTTAAVPNSDADYLVRNMNDDDNGGHF